MQTVVREAYISHMPLKFDDILRNVGESSSSVTILYVHLDLSTNLEAFLLADR